MGSLYSMKPKPFISFTSTISPVPWPAKWPSMSALVAVDPHPSVGVVSKRGQQRRQREVVIRTCSREVAQVKAGARHLGHCERWKGGVCRPVRGHFRGEVVVHVGGETHRVCELEGITKCKTGAKTGLPAGRWGVSNGRAAAEGFLKGKRQAERGWKLCGEAAKDPGKPEGRGTGS